MKEVAIIGLGTSNSDFEDQFYSTFFFQQTITFTLEAVSLIFWFLDEILDANLHIFDWKLF